MLQSGQLPRSTIRCISFHSSESLQRSYETKVLSREPLLACPGRSDLVEMIKPRLRVFQPPELPDAPRTAILPPSRLHCNVTATQWTQGLLALRTGMLMVLSGIKCVPWPLFHWKYLRQVLRRTLYWHDRKPSQSQYLGRSSLGFLRSSASSGPPWYCYSSSPDVMYNANLVGTNVGPGSWSSLMGELRVCAEICTVHRHEFTQLRGLWPYRDDSTWRTFFSMSSGHATEIA